MGEVMKRVKAVPTSGSGETYYGRDIFKVQKKWSSYSGIGTNEYQNDRGEAIDVVYHAAQGFTNRNYDSVVGTDKNGRNFSTISQTVTTEDGTVLKLVNGAVYKGDIVIRPYEMKSQLMNLAGKFTFTIQGVDVREPIVKVEETQKALGLADVSIATVDSLDTQFAKNKIDVTDNVTPKNKLQQQAEFKFIDPQNPGKELSLEDVKEQAKKSGSPKHYGVRVKVSDDAGYQAGGVNGVKIPGTVIVAPATIATPDETEKVVVLNSGDLSKSDKARIIDAVKKANPQNVLLNFPDTDIQVTGDTVGNAMVNITYPHGSESVQVSVDKVASDKKTDKSENLPTDLDDLSDTTGYNGTPAEATFEDIEKSGSESGAVTVIGNVNPVGDVDRVLSSFDGSAGLPTDLDDLSDTTGYNGTPAEATFEDIEKSGSESGAVTVIGNVNPVGDVDRVLSSFDGSAGLPTDLDDLSDTTGYNGTPAEATFEDIEKSGSESGAVTVIGNVNPVGDVDRVLSSFDGSAGLPTDLDDLSDTTGYNGTPAEAVFDNVKDSEEDEVNSVTVIGNANPVVDGSNIVVGHVDETDAADLSDLDDLNPLGLGHPEEETNINDLADGGSFVTGDGGTSDIIVSDVPGAASVLPEGESGSSFTGVDYPEVSELAGLSDFGVPVSGADTADRPGVASVLPEGESGSSFTGVLEYPELDGLSDFGFPVSGADTADRPGVASVLPEGESGSSFTGVLEYPELDGLSDFGVPVSGADTADRPGVASVLPEGESGSSFTGVLEYPELDGLSDFGVPVSGADTADRPGVASTLPETETGSSFTGVLEYPELDGLSDFGVPVSGADTADRPGVASALPETESGSSFTGVLEYPELDGLSDFGVPVSGADTADRPGVASTLPVTETGSVFAGMLLEYPELDGLSDFGVPVSGADTADRPGVASTLPVTETGSVFAGMLLEYPEIAGVRDFGLSADSADSADGADSADSADTVGLGQPIVPVLDNGGVSSAEVEKLPQTGADSRAGLLGAAGLGLAGVLSVFGARKRRED
ncbi:LPXTG cell wall anchor domain-containing protein [Arcanobacterium hippocoleae]